MFDVLKAVLGILLVMGVWFGVQAFVRKQKACGRDHDVLESMAHGCAGCNGSASCRNIDHKEAVEKERNHELV